MVAQLLVLVGVGGLEGGRVLHLLLYLGVGVGALVLAGVAAFSDRLLRRLRGWLLWIA